MIAAHKANAASLPARATKQAHIFNNIAYKLLVETAENELESLFDNQLEHKVRRAKTAKIEQVRSRPLQPKHPLQLRSGALPYKWLQE